MKVTVTSLEDSQHQAYVPFVTKLGVDLASNHPSDGHAELRDGAEQLEMEMMQAYIM